MAQQPAIGATQKASFQQNIAGSALFKAAKPGLKVCVRLTSVPMVNDVIQELGLTEVVCDLLTQTCVHAEEFHSQSFQDRCYGDIICMGTLSEGLNPESLFSYVDRHRWWGIGSPIWLAMSNSRFTMGAHRGTPGLSMWKSGVIITHEQPWSHGEYGVA